MTPGVPSALVAVPECSEKHLRDAADACEAAEAPDRHLDARIALAVFPPLRKLPQVHPGVWQHPDGDRVRALRYSFTPTAAAMLVPAGHWLESDPNVPVRMWVYGPGSEDAASASNKLPALAISAAALRILCKRLGNKDV